MLYCKVSAGTHCYIPKMSSGHLYVSVCVCVRACTQISKCLVTSLLLKTLAPYDYHTSRDVERAGEREREKGGVLEGAPLIVRMQEVDIKLL